METEQTAKEILDYVVIAFQIDINSFSKKFIKETIKEIGFIIDTD